VDENLILDKMYSSRKVKTAGDLIVKCKKTDTDMYFWNKH